MGQVFSDLAIVEQFVSLAPIGGDDRIGTAADILTSNDAVLGDDSDRAIPFGWGRHAQGKGRLMSPLGANSLARSRERGSARQHDDRHRLGGCSRAKVYSHR